MQPHAADAPWDGGRPAQNARIVLRPRTASDRERQALESTHHLRGSAAEQVEELLTRADARLPADALAMVLDRVVRNAEIFGGTGHAAASALQRAAFGFSAHATRCMRGRGLSVLRAFAGCDGSIRRISGVIFRTGSLLAFAVYRVGRIAARARSGSARTFTGLVGATDVFG